MLNIFKSLKKREYLFLGIMVLLIVGQVYLELKMPDYMSEITVLVKTPNSLLSDIIKQGKYMLLCALGSLILTFIIGLLSSIISATISKNIREQLFNKVQDFNMEEMKKFSVSSLITRTTNDITNIQMFISMGMQLIVRSPIMAIWAILKILDKGIEWSIATGGAVLILFIFIVILMLIVLPNFKKMQKLIDDVNNVTRENLKGIRVVRAFNAEEYEQNKFNEKNNNLTKVQMFNQKMMSIISPVMSFVMPGLNLTIYIIGAYLIKEASGMEKLTVFSNMVVFSSYSMQVIMSFVMLTVIFIMYPRANVSLKRINEVLKTKPSIINGKEEKYNDSKNVIEFQNVSFKYPDGQDYVLKDITFKVPKGKTTAIIGSTGSGKSTLVNLITRFYDVNEGSVVVGGTDVRKYNREYLYNKIGYVPQKATLFSGTIYDNITYGSNGKKISKKEVMKSAEIAQASEFIGNMPKKYDDDVSQGGTNLSGGQRQRIAIARAIARDPEILIFDDAFSALDYKTDKNLRKALKENCQKATNIIVAQRIGTIIDADQIIVLDEGKIVGIGTHQELLKKCSVYKEIAYSQVSKEELENVG